MKGHYRPLEWHSYELTMSPNAHSFQNEQHLVRVVRTKNVSCLLAVRKKWVHVFYTQATKLLCIISDIGESKCEPWIYCCQYPGCDLLCSFTKMSLLRRDERGSLHRCCVPFLITVCESKFISIKIAPRKGGEGNIVYMLSLDVHQQIGEV